MAVPPMVNKALLNIYFWGGSRLTGELVDINKTLPLTKKNLKNSYSNFLRCSIRLPFLATFKCSSLPRFGIGVSSPRDSARISRPRPKWLALFRIIVDRSMGMELNIEYEMFS